MRKYLPLTTLSLAMFIIVIDTTIMNVSISALVVDLDTTVTGIQGAISIYALVMASFMLIGGRLADIFGPKRMFIIGLVVYSIGTTIASLSTSLGMLIIGWSILEGLGAALMIPNIQVLLRDHYEGSDLAFSYGIISAVAAVGAALGPIVGGFFTTFFSWRWAFRSELVIAVIVFFLARSLLPDNLTGERPKFDYLGALLNVFGWSAIVLGILLAQTYGFFVAKQPFVIGSWEIAPLGLSISPIMVGLGVLLILLLFRWETRLETQGGDGLFQPSIFKTPGIKAGFSNRFLQVGITAAFLYITPLLLQLTFEYTAMQTGVFLLPFSLSLLAAAILGARLSSRVPAYRLVQAGFILAAVGLGIIAAAIQPDVSASELAWGAIFGAGMGLVASQLLNLILSSVDEEKTAVTAGLTSTFEQLGNAIAVALVGTVMMVVLTTHIQDRVVASQIIPEEHKAGLITAVEDGVQLVTNSTVDQALDEAGVSAAVANELTDIYGDSRTDAFKAAVSLLIYASLLGLVLTLWLPKRKLVEEG